MYITISVDKSSSSGERTDIQVSSPFNYRSSGKNPGTLYYTRLPANFSEEDIINKIVCGSWNFVGNSEYNFLVVFVAENPNRQNWTLVRDRFGSQRVLIRDTKDSLIVTTDPRAVRHENTKWNPKGLRYALASRIITEVALEADVSILPFSHGLLYDDKNGLALIQTGAKSLEIEESQDRLSDEKLIDSIKNSILESYQLVSRDKPVAVLLSGGVDSFILAAIACKHFTKVKAYTPTWIEGENPELDRAIAFSKKLGIEHHVITITSKEFNLSFFEMIEANGIPNRNYSSLVLHALFKSIPEEHILYGEYADTLFGSFPVKTGIIDRSYGRVLSFLPNSIFPERIKEILSNIKLKSLRSLILIPSVTERFIEKHLISLDIDPSQKSGYELQKMFTRVAAIEFILKTDCSQHMIEIETSALLFGKKIVTPFYNQRMVAISNQLSSRQMFGDSELSIRKNFKKDTSVQVKPLLKKLACQFIEPEAIYLKKLGFPTPFASWVQDFIIASDGRYISSSLESQESEQIWSSINFACLTKKNVVSRQSNSD